MRHFGESSLKKDDTPIVLILILTLKGALKFQPQLNKQIPGASSGRGRGPSCRVSVSCRKLWELLTVLSTSVRKSAARDFFRTKTTKQDTYCGWTKSISHHLRNLGMRIPRNNGFPWIQSGAGFRPSTVGPTPGPKSAGGHTEDGFANSISHHPRSIGVPWFGNKRSDS